ncbi:MAG TPA: helix-turn-helix domain-containing protein, partial [Gemmatimonadaceae bacterium]|nr:helix-turn-helix domain-containing protein [Gemmatimonadaceae bacterium]
MKRVVAAIIEQATSDDAGRAMDGLRRVVRALRTGNVQAERTLGISSAQLFALRAIAAQPGGSLRDLAERTLTSQSSVSEVMARLAARRLIKR